MMLALTSPFDVNWQGESLLQCDSKEEAADDDVVGGEHEAEEADHDGAEEQRRLHRVVVERVLQHLPSDEGQG